MHSKVAVSLTSFAQYDSSPKEILEKAGMEVVLNPHGWTVTEKEIITLAAGAVGLIAGTENLSALVLEQLKDLKVISRCGVGMDNVDFKAAERLGIKVFSTPDGPTIAVAELVIGLAFNLLRQISAMDRAIRAGQWQKKMGSLFSGKKIGIIGLGRIGQAVASLSLSLNAYVLYYDPGVKTKIPKARRVELHPLLREADIVTVHVPFSQTTKHLLGKEQLGLMKKDSLLINCSRGGVIDEEALFAALQDKKLAGAALDVFEQEPYKGPLKDLDNVLLTPHIGSYAREARVAMEMEAVNNLLKALAERSLR